MYAWLIDSWIICTLIWIAIIHIKETAINLHHFSHFWYLLIFLTPMLFSPPIFKLHIQYHYCIHFSEENDDREEETPFKKSIKARMLVTQVCIECVKVKMLVTKIQCRSMSRSICWSPRYSVEVCQGQDAGLQGTVMKYVKTKMLVTKVQYKSVLRSRWRSSSWSWKGSMFRYSHPVTV